MGTGLAYFEDEDSGTFAHNEAFAVFVEGARC